MCVCSYWYYQGGLVLEFSKYCCSETHTGAVHLTWVGLEMPQGLSCDPYITVYVRDTECEVAHTVQISSFDTTAFVEMFNLHFNSQSMFVHIFTLKSRRQQFITCGAAFIMLCQLEGHIRGHCFGVFIFHRQGLWELFCVHLFLQLTRETKRQLSSLPIYSCYRQQFYFCKTFVLKSQISQSQIEKCWTNFSTRLFKC